MKTQEIKQLEDACVWALSKESPKEAKVLVKEFARRKVDHAGEIGWMYETPPLDRVHMCVELNLAQIPVAWIEYDERYGFQLVSTNVYGDGTITEVQFCPFCGEKLSV